MPFPDAASRWTFQSVADSVRRQSRWMEVLGVLLLLLGTFCLIFVVATTLATAFLIGAVLLAAGAAQIAAATAYWRRRGGGFALGIILGALCIGAGILCMMNPAGGLRALTFILGIYLIASGIARLAINLRERFPGWGWSAASAVSETLLGILTLAYWPHTSFFILGTILGIQLLFSGTTALAVGAAVRAIVAPRPEPPRRERPATRFQH
jgi:uncharacterized membrane protein HdeD (DUF308 family)